MIGMPIDFGLSKFVYLIPKHSEACVCWSSTTNR